MLSYPYFSLPMLQCFLHINPKVAFDKIYCKEETGKIGWTLIQNIYVYFHKVKFNSFKIIYEATG